MAAKAKKVLVPQRPGASAKKAALVKVKANKVVSLQVKGLAPNTLVIAEVKLAKKWVSLGSARTKANGRVALPAFQASLAGRYVIRLTSVGTASFIAVVVKGKA